MLARCLSASLQGLEARPVVVEVDLARPQLEGLWCAGELGLDGSLRPCRGVIALAAKAQQHKAQALVVPPENVQEASLIEGLTIRTAANLRTLVEQLKGERPWPATGGSSTRSSTQPTKPASWPCLDSSLASRALALSAAGGHHLLLVGPPGCGKTRLAHQLPRLLPALSRKEALSITRIHSVAGQLHGIDQLQQQRPFRSPHHSCSAATLLGGGRSPRPGEVSLAHGGVLFLDELAEFPRAVLDQLRQPLEDGAVQISRAQQSTVFPALVTLVAATNPLPLRLAWRPRPWLSLQHQPAPALLAAALRPALGSARSATAAGTALRQGGGSGAEAAQPNASCSVLVHPRTN